MKVAVCALAGFAVGLGSLTPSSDASAQVRRPVSVGLAVGATVPTSDFADDTKTGLHGAAFLQYEPDAGIWGVRGEVSYHRSQYTDDFLGAVAATPDDDLNNGVFHAGATALLIGNNRNQGVTPYLLGGLGLYRLTVSVSDGSTTLSDSENGFGFNGGAGIRIGRSAGFFVEARFHRFSITPELGEKSTYQMIPVTVGVRF
ncbi:MAG: outer membrane beta-barrel protein [Gemmatimonadaceae bacterium]